MTNKADTQELLRLLPCPFCGGEAAWGEGEQKEKYGNEQVYCTSCYATSAPEMNKDEAAAWWNSHGLHRDLVPSTSPPAVDSQPVPAGQDEVEKALAELREMFPGEPVSIEFHDYSGIEGCAENGYITVTSGTHQSTEATLVEAMQKVREWKEQQDA